MGRSHVQPCLVVLAAGQSSRYGGLKQLEPVGPSGQALLEYSIHDARRSGFGDVLLVVRPELESAVHRWASQRRGHLPPLDYVLQRVEDVPAGADSGTPRVKPWGTGQAVLALTGRVATPFAVINADDFYGRSSFAMLYEHLTGQAVGSTTDFAVVGFRLEETLSPHGGVSRAICRRDRAGHLVEVQELSDIRRDGDAIAGRLGSDGVPLSGESLASMNMWGFTPAVFSLLLPRFATFLESWSRHPAAEFLLPDAVNDMVARGAATVRVLRARGSWFGMTHPEDRERASERLRALVAAGVYPHRLFDM